jgi:prepilin-type N-terminal cleavage/methylation domain-containing protein
MSSAKSLGKSGAMGNNIIKKPIQTDQGFSLVELMVVVAIMGILAMVAIPSYKGFIAKSRQKEAVNLLSAYYTAAKATYAEFGRYPGNFVQTGFQPVGEIQYRLRTRDGNNIPIHINDDDCFTTANARTCDCGGACRGFKTWIEATPGGTIGSRTGPSGVNGIGGCPGGWHGGVTDNTFSITALGVVSTSSANYDMHEINHLKVYTICQDGTK